MKVTLGILAHVDAGKTTLSEQLLYRCGVLRRCGRVDDGDACLDFTPVERSRGITVFTAGASFSHGSNDYFLLDTPGHGDFSPEMERCLAAMDWAVLLISAAGGFDAHTERLWRLLEARGIPTAVFLNKCDLPGADGDAVLADVARRTGAPLWDLRRGLTEAAREQAALTDDGALEAYLSGTLDDGGLWDAAARAAGRRQLIPVFAGSALQGDGVAELLDGLDRLCRTAYDAAGPAELLAPLFKPAQVFLLMVKHLDYLLAVYHFFDVSAGTARAAGWPSASSCLERCGRGKPWPARRSTSCAGCWAPAGSRWPRPPPAK